MINICIIATIVIYLVGMLLVGFVYSKSNEDSSDFYLGGRTMGPLVTAMSAEASDMSSWLLMGMPGLAYLTAACAVTRPIWMPSRCRSSFPCGSMTSATCSTRWARSLSSCSSSRTPLPALPPAASCSTACLAWITWRL